MTKVIIDRGCGLNILFARSLKEFGLSTLDLTPPHYPFFGLIPGEPATPLGRIVLPVTFGDRNNYRTEHICFTVADFDTAYHAILGRPALAKFMAVPYYVRTAYACEKETLDAATAAQLSSRMEQVLAASNEVDPADLEIPTKKPSKDAIKARPKETKKVSLELDDPAKTVTIVSELDPK
ncbi:unnamed protein product [Urochloa humidicola]